jgi:prolyl oligopeptidase
MYKKSIYFLILIPIFYLVFGLSGCTKGEPPVAKKENVADTFHGVTVSDPYRWLENWDDQAVQSWSEGQNTYARNFLNNLPSVDALQERIKEIRMAKTVSHYETEWQGGKLFAMKYQPPLNQSLLVILPNADQPDQEKVLVDPNAMDTTHSTSIDWYVPSPDGKYVAVSMSVGGSESGDLYIFDTESATQVDVVIKRVNGGTAGGDMTWLPDGSGYYYTRYPRQGERPDEDMNFFQQIWFHQMGSSIDTDRYVFGKDAPRIAEFRLAMHYKTGKLLITMQRGDSGEFEYYILNPDGKMVKLASYADKISEAILAPGNYLFLISQQEAPRGKILRLSMSNPAITKAKEIIPQGDNTIVSSFYSKSQVIVTKERIYITYQLGGPDEIRAFDYNGNSLPSPGLLPVSSVYELSSFNGNDILYRNASYIEPPAWYHFETAFNQTRKTALANEYPVDYSDCEVVRDLAISKDGTQIPVNIIRRKGITLDGSHPVLLTAYGGFGSSNSPGFSSLNRIWIEQGGVYAVANIRGGGEFGEEWHRGGMLTNKQNCFDDFVAAMQYMIDQKYTTREKMAIIGGSNGGLLMGAILTQFPDMFKATVAMVGLYDMIRSELTPNGSFNIPEYGTVEDEDQFRALYAYSPYHNVKDETAYPAVLFMTGANDPRVDPMHSRKMTARLQEATTSVAPILLRTSAGTGHGYGTPLAERIKEDVHKFSFLFQQLNMTYSRID